MNLILLFFLVSSCWAQDISFPTHVYHWPDSEGWLSPKTGTGFLTKHGVITAGHVAGESGLPANTGQSRDGKVYKVLHSGSCPDIGLIVGCSPAGAELRISRTAAKSGDLVFIWGTDEYGRSESYKVRVLSGGRNGSTNLVPGLGYGDSGSPVLNLRGEVVGVFTHVNFKRGIGWFQGVEVIQELLGEGDSKTRTHEVHANDMEEAQ